MVNFDLEKYARDNWCTYLQPITTISAANDGSEFISRSDQIYNFDRITENIFPDEIRPTSVDGIFFKENSIILVEFKTGFCKKIRKDSYKDSPKAVCQKANPQEICNDYWQTFFKCQDLETKELINSIKLKAVESYNTLKNDIAPFCKRTKEPIKIVLMVVIDTNANDETVEILGSLASPSPITGINDVKRVYQALKRFKTKHEHLKYYYFDEIIVYSKNTLPGNVFS